MTVREDWLQTPQQHSHKSSDMQIKLVKILQELAESKHKACPKHQRER